MEQASKVEFCNQVNAAQVASNGDWACDSITALMNKFDDDAFRTSREKKRKEKWTRLKGLRAISNRRTEVRQEYCKLFGNGDELLNDAVEGLDAALVEKFLSADQSKRLKLTKDPRYAAFVNMPWGAAQWKTLGCPTAISNEITSLRGEIEREKLIEITSLRGDDEHEEHEELCASQCPIIHSPIELHERIVDIAQQVCTDLEGDGDTNTPGGRRQWARLIAFSVYALGGPRFCDIIPGKANAHDGSIATCMDDVLEHQGQRVRYYYISKSYNAEAKWRVALFPVSLVARILSLYNNHFTALECLTKASPKWVASSLENRGGRSHAFTGIDFDSYGDTDGYVLTPYRFKHLGVSLMSSLFYVTNAHSRYVAIHAIQIGHVDTGSVAKYLIFEVDRTGSLPTQQIRLGDDGLYLMPWHSEHRPAKVMRLHT